ncbi:MAG: hypothetical protein N3G20_04550, partial [Verrucomicrobiae bacterium]|nr:hypothetical protein [Verrucomicrobiae bacterium]
ALRFPTHWVFDRVLFRGNYADTSLIQYKGKWWAFTTRHPYTFEIWHADKLTGPWSPHVKNPIYRREKGCARSGGCPVLLGDKIVRFVQDSRRGYGTGVRAFLVNTINTETFEEHPLAPDPLLSPAGQSWAKYGMHHFCPVGSPDGVWFAVIDGNGDPGP